MDFQINFTFWLLFCALNFSFFIPQYLVNILDSTFLPSTRNRKKHNFKTLLTLFYWRTSDDIFRFNFDVILPSALLLFIAGRTIHFHGLLVGISCFFFIYQIYYHAIKKLYVAEPIIYVDFDLIKTGAGILFYGYRKYIILIPVLIFGIYGFYKVLWFNYLNTIDNSQFGFIDYTVLGLFLLLGLWHLTRVDQIWGYYKNGIISVSFLLFYDLRQSILTYLNLNKIINSREKKNVKSNELDLHTKPNLFFVFIESYGNVINTEEELSTQFKKYQEQRVTSLKEKGWSMSTNLSTSCRTGGGSWLVYTSFYYGMQITDIGIFRALTKKNIQEHFKSLFHIFKQAGYRNYYLTPLTGFGKFKINWDEIASTYAADKIIKNEDLNYSGKHLTSFGQQPPDQYSLNAAYDIMQESTDPTTLFFLSLNSHAAWHSPLSIEQDWKEIATKDFETTIPSKEDLKKNYLTAINYQLDYCTDFIEKRMSDNDIFVMIGDHQPPLISSDIKDFNTPIHIISKNSNLHASLKQYGFGDGLSSIGKTAPIRHEALYSLLLRELSIHYSNTSPNLIPPYQPEGIKI